MSKRFITADWHLGEGRFRIMQRPFTSVAEQTNYMVGMHNELVSPDDTVYVVGDVVNQKTPEYLEEVSRFNGRKILIRGNHDRVFTDEQLAPYFDQIVPDGGGVHLDVAFEEDDMLRCWVTHYPTQGKELSFNLVGHIHTAWKVQLNALNIGVDANHFKPLDIDEDVPFLFGAIRDFYDEDVWVAYAQAQAMWRGLRGKAGRYLDVDGLVGGGGM